MTYQGVWEWGDVDEAFAEADHVVKIRELHFDRFNSTPLELDGALVEFNRGTGTVDGHDQQPVPGFAVIMMAPAMHVGTDKLRMVTQDIGGGFGNKITSHRSSSRAACSRGSSTGRSSGPSGGRTSTSPCPTATTAGSSTPRSR